MSVEDDASFAIKIIFWFGEALKSDDLTIDGLGREFVWLEEGVGFIEFLGVSSFAVVLWVWCAEMI